MESLPVVVLPGRLSTRRQAGEELGRLLAATNQYYFYGGQMVRREEALGRIVLQPRSMAEVAAAFESVASLYKSRPTKDDPDGIVPAICTDTEVKGILATDTFQDNLGVVRIVSRCPVLLERDGELVTVIGFDRQSGILAGGQPPVEMGHMDGVRLLEKVIADFDFATDGDRARAIAAMLSPAMVQGGLLSRLAPIDFSEANASQTGKGFRNKLLAAIYNDTIATITQPRGGGLKQVLSAALAKGARFISLDNFRNGLEDPTLESLMTEEGLMLLSNGRTISVDPRGITVMLTSNGLTSLPDLANRVSMVRIKKRAEGYRWQTFPEGNILDHVQANQPKFLGAVFSVIKAWHMAGKPESEECRHSFLHWARPLDFIVQAFFRTAPLLDGHKEAQAAMLNDRLKWLWDAGVYVMQAGHADKDLTTGQILDILLPHANRIDLPNHNWERNPKDPAVRKGLLQALGSRLTPFFFDSDSQEIGGVTVTRQERKRKGSGRRDAVYRFTGSPTGSGTLMTGFLPE